MTAVSGGIRGRGLRPVGDLRDEWSSRTYGFGVVDGFRYLGEGGGVVGVDGPVSLQPGDENPVGVLQHRQYGCAGYDQGPPKCHRHLIRRRWIHRVGDLGFDDGLHRIEFGCVGIGGFG